MAFTFFYRDIHTIEQAVEKFLPIVDGRQKIKIWDAGCANGPEPYTLLILLSERMSYFAFKKVHLDATDIDESSAFGDIIKNGIYSYDEIKRIPITIQEKYFSKVSDDNKFLIHEKIRSKISFYQNDLTKLQPVNSNYNLIICKNVLLHLSPKQRVEVIRMFHRVLDTKGLLVTEQTQKMPEELNSLFDHLASDAQIYMKK